MCAIFAIVIAERNKLWEATSLTFVTEVHHLREGGSLVGHKEQVCNVIVVNPRNLGIVIQLSLLNRFAPVSWIVHHILTFVHVASTNWNLQSVRALPCYALSFWTLVSIIDCNWSLRSGIDDMKLSFFGKKSQKRAIVIPRHTPWQVLVTLIIEHSLLHLHVPNANTSCLSSGCECHFSSRMPLHEHDLLGVASHNSLAFFNISSHFFFRHLPEPKSGIAWSSCKQIFMERREVQILNWTIVAPVLRSVKSNSTLIVVCPYAEITSIALPRDLYRN